MARNNRQLDDAIEIRGIDGIITVDSTTDITMICMRSVYAGCYIHFGTEQAISNLVGGAGANSTANPKGGGNDRTQLRVTSQEKRLSE